VEEAVTASAPGADLRVDYSSIEKSLSELWRAEKKDKDDAVTRAALWNVVAHTWNPKQHSRASEILSRASAKVPQRTIVVRAEPDAPPDITAWISTNCHLVGGEKQVCSEEVAIVAGGDHVDRVPPIVNALLIPDMPVAVWWVGDLPSEHQTYVETLLEPADRVIVDSSHFDAPSDLATVANIGQQTTTAPADLNWVRLEEWRVATAMLFDPPAARQKLLRIRGVTVAACSSGAGFGDLAESLLFAAWLTVQARREGIHYNFETEKRPLDSGSLCRVSIEFDDGSKALIHRDDDRSVLIASMDGVRTTVESVTRVLSRGPEDLIVRLLKRPEADQVFVKALPVATQLALTL
jgi:glucose-6-phosphate dehydrogenase assembly protein OpcA